MAKPNIRPLAAGWGKVSDYGIYRRNTPPVFPNPDDCTPSNCRLALKLWRALDLESRRWYVELDQTTFCGEQLTKEDLEALYGTR